MNHPDLGWLGFGGEVSTHDGIAIKPFDTFRQRVYLAPLGLYLTLDAGRFESVHYNPANGTVTLALDPAEEFTPNAMLRIEQPAERDGVGDYTPTGQFERQRGAWVVPLGEQATSVELRSAS